MLSNRKNIEKNNINQSKTSIDKNIKSQSTVLASFKVSGMGVHSGKTMTIELLPASIDTGIIFIRSDLQSQNEIPALFSQVTSTTMSTTLSNQHGASVSTVEHLIAALVGCGITNCIIKVDGPEIPIMDGSSKPFCEAISKAGILIQEEHLKTLKILSPIRVEGEKAWAEFRPFDTRQFNMKFDFYGRMPQKYMADGFYSFDIDQDSFFDLISHARTFGFYKDAEMLREKGLAKGAGLHNTVIIKDDDVMNKEGLRHDFEFVQHKILDAIGDIGLSSFHIIGAYVAYNGSHALNNQLMRKLFASVDSWVWSESSTKH
jgi:UDP-3-O-[3-hydroxymyristoyl] N-acetylglucosamine deacetylase